jgi:hypothetical protein
LNGHGNKLNRKQEAVIAFLLVEATVEQAAAKAGVGYRTLRGWMALPDFQAAYRSARRIVLENAIAGLQRTTADAVKALMRNLTCGEPGPEIRAAQIVLELAFKGAELLEMEERLQALEAAAKAKEGQP